MDFGALTTKLEKRTAILERSSVLRFKLKGLKGSLQGINIYLGILKCEQKSQLAIHKCSL